MGARGLFMLEDVAGVRTWGEAVVVGEEAELPGEGATPYWCMKKSADERLWVSYGSRLMRGVPCSSLKGKIVHNFVT